MASDEQRPGGPFLYDAFISYRHVDRDRKWAEWLIDALERYRVPEALQRRGIPPRLQKIFRDEDEVPASSDLNDQIKTALLASRFLIVVCSAFTPRSKWVEREIEMFNELGRGDQVLALLTEGEPGDSFPAAMLVRRRQMTEADGSTRIVNEDKEPLAADVRPRPGVSMRLLKRMALLRLVSVLLGVKFDDLRQRDHEREARRWRFGAALAGALVLLLAGAGAGYWELMRPHTAHYRALTWRWGLPQGLGEIDEETRRHLGTSFSFTTRRASLFQPPQVVDVRRENSAGTLRAANGQAHWRVHYEQDGASMRIETLNAADDLVLESQLERRAGIQIETLKRNSVDFAQTVRLVFDSRNAVNAKTDITRREVTLDDRGFAVRRSYQNHYGIPQHDANGSYGQSIVNSSDGLNLRIAEVGADGNEITLNNGVRAITFTYGSNYLLTSRTLIGPDNKPIDGRDGYANYTLSYDRWGNIATIEFHAADGRPALSEQGFAKFVGTYDERGNQIQSANLGLDGRPTLNTNGIAIAREEFDQRGNAVARAYFGVDDKPTASKQGFVKVKLVYDDRGRLNGMEFFGSDGRPALGIAGSASLSHKFDTSGNVIETAYFGLDGKPTQSKEGYAKVRNTYNPRGQNVRNDYFGVDDRPVLNAAGLASMATAYDSRGNVAKIDFFGVDGKRILTPQLGVAGLVLTFDDRGTLSRMEFVGLDGKPAPGTMMGNCAELRMAYDDHGNLTEATCIGVEGKPALGPVGYSVQQREIDQRGNLVQVSYLGLDGKPTISREGVAKITYAYDGQNREVERAYYGLDGMRTLFIDPSAMTDGYAGVRLAYDDRGNVVERSHFGLDTKPILSREGIAKITYAYDVLGREIRRAFYDAHDQPTLGTSGYASFARQFDARGNEIETAFFGLDGKPVQAGTGYAKVLYSYDTVGRETDARYFDAQGHQLAVDVVIAGVIPNTTAALLGFAPGDRIIDYDGRKPTSVKQFADAIVDASGHQLRRLVLRRGPDDLKFEVAPGLLGVNTKIMLSEVPSATSVGPSAQPIAHSP